ncbi:hypothetical protein [Myxococcus sp. Y35]|uniref:hypothetical protein n=1 Tax=Pseudomyxococcus flavus TaxID=3115648 RepID=UPI003CF011D2
MTASSMQGRARRVEKGPVKPYFKNDLITLYLADCRDQLVDLPSASVDLLLTDPPYGMAYEGKGRSAAAIRADGSRQGMRVLRQALSAASAALAPDAHVYVYCHWESWPDFYDAVSAHLRIKGALVWWRSSPESCVVGSEGVRGREAPWRHQAAAVSGVEFSRDMSR